jgi:hypothetical protein
MLCRIVDLIPSPIKGDTLKKKTAKKTTRFTKKPLSKTASRRLKVGPVAHVIKRKTKAAGAATTRVKKAVKKVVRKSKQAASIPAATTRKAKQMGRAVGTVLGKAIGNVERVVSRVMKRAQTTTKK